VKAKAKKAPKDPGVSQSQDANVAESLGNEPLQQTKAGAIASPKETNKGRKKAAKCKLYDMKELDVSPQQSSEPQKKKRKVQKGLPQPLLRSGLHDGRRRKPLKAPREKGTNKS